MPWPLRPGILPLGRHAGTRTICPERDAIFVPIPAGRRLFSGDKPPPNQPQYIRGYRRNNQTKGAG